MRAGLSFLFLALASGPVLACGWWGDGENSSVDSSIVVDAAGREVESRDPMQDPALMVRYGDRFRTGQGAPRDLNLAVHWYRLAAERGHPGGQYNLALMYDIGLGVVQDPARAVHWYRQAALQGDVHAQHHLGQMLLDGRGTGRDPRQGVDWLEAAARQGHAEVFPLVAEAYARGTGVAPDPVAAYRWYWLAAERGDGAARQRSGELAGLLDPRQRARARAEAATLAAGWTAPQGRP